MYMAGIYRVENGRPVFTILTRDPAESISFIHNRMPVLLPSDMVPDWINPKYSVGDL
jgi:putative SOS response-associated peptidase YedK